jgi:hypothetical protein
LNRTFYVEVMVIIVIVHTVKLKVKVQVWTTPEGYRKFRLQDFKTIGT